MRPIALPPLFLLIAPTLSLQIPSIPAAFYEPYTDESFLAVNESSVASHELLKRQAGGCPANFNPCVSNGYKGACCTAGSFCTMDGARNVACCPNGATCTGTITAGAPVSQTGGGAIGPSSTAATLTTTGPVAVVTNPYFPFPIIATNYPNSAACNTAYEACQTNYAACTQILQGGGGGFGVTVVAPGGGVTVAPTGQSLAPASATSVCSSLSQQACYGIVSDNCAQFGQGTGGSFIVGSTGAAARQTARCYAAAGVMAGVGLGLLAR